MSPDAKHAIYFAKQRYRALMTRGNDAGISFYGVGFLCMFETGWEVVLDGNGKVIVARKVI